MRIPERVTILPAAPARATSTGNVSFSDTSRGGTRNTSRSTPEPVPVPSAVKTTGLPTSAPAVASRVLVPGVGPSVQVPTRAIPSVLVVWAGPLTLPSPAVTAKVTSKPSTGSPDSSSTRTAGRVGTSLPAGAL